MKKAVQALMLMLVGLSAVMIFRAQSTYRDVQPEPFADVGSIVLDEAAITARLSEAIRIPTFSFDDRTRFDRAAFLEFHGHLEDSFPLVHERTERLLVNDYSLVFRLRGSDPRLKPVLFMSHMDVVPVESVSRSAWTEEPLGGRVADGIIWGRGTLDNKQGVMALMEALELQLAAGAMPERSVYFAFGHDEEVGGFDGAKKIAEYFISEAVEFEFVLDEGGAVTEGVMTQVDRPVAIIGIAEKGYVNVRLTVDAAGGHSSQPPPQSAVGILARAIARVEDNPFPADLTFLERTYAAIASETGFFDRFVMANRWLLSPVIEWKLLADSASAAALRTTTAATMVAGSPKSNILPTRATGVINFRIMPGETVETVRDRVAEIVDDERVSVTTEMEVNPSAVSPTDSWGYELIGRTIRGFDAEVLIAPYLVQGGTDAKYFYNVSPNVYRFVMIRIDPNTLTRVHGIDEQIKVVDYLSAVRFYHSIIGRAMRGE